MGQGHGLARSSLSAADKWHVSSLTTVHEGKPVVLVVLVQDLLQVQTRVLPKELQPAGLDLPGALGCPLPSNCKH